MALAIAIAGLLIAAPTATAKVYKFRVLSASETNTMTATKGCLSGKRSFSSSTSTPSEDPDSSYNTDDGYGSIGTTATSASFHDDEMSNSCSMPPCHYDYGTRQLQDKSIGVFVEEIPGSADLKVSAGIFGLEVGSIEGPCGDISVNWPSEPFVNVPKAELFSGEPVQITISGEQPFTQDILGNPITASVSYTNKMTVQALGKKLKADPGGAYTVRRAGRVTLDGSRSKPRAAIRDYIWKFDTLDSDCGGVSTAPGARKEGRQIKVVALCGLKATLTVVGRDGERDSASTNVRVLPRGPRGWRTPFDHREKTGDSRTPHDPPEGIKTGAIEVAFSLDGALNVSDCGKNVPKDEILCPPQRPRASWLGDGYGLAKVDDPHGPFDGYSYVASSKLSVKRAALINPTILPGSAFYKHNLAVGRDVAGFLAAVRQHEGMGNGTPGTGHSQIIKAILRTEAGDPRRVIERLFAPHREGAREKVDKALHEIDGRLDKESDDPLPDIWTGEIDFYDSYLREWLHGYDFRIPGNMTG